MFFIFLWLHSIYIIILTMGNQHPPSKQLHINHPRLKNSYLSHNNDHILTHISFDNQNDFQRWKEILSQIKPYEDDCLLLPKHYSNIKQPMCGNSGYVEVQYENYSTVLHDQLHSRQKPFEQKELWYLLYCLCLCSYKFKQIGKKVGDINTHNIFLNESTNSIKIVNVGSWPCEYTNYQKTIFDHQITNLAPQEVKQAKQGRIQTKTNKFMAQSFSIGITLLETALLRSCEGLYSELKKNFNYQLLRSLLGQFSKLDNYSEELKSTISGLCEVNIERRISAEAIYLWLKVHDSQIINLKEFYPCLPFKHNFVTFCHQPANHHHFMTQQKHKFSQGPSVQLNDFHLQKFSFGDNLTEPKDIPQYPLTQIPQHDLKHKADFSKHLSSQLRIQNNQ